jgi:hypothetical protein
MLVSYDGMAGCGSMSGSGFPGLWKWIFACGTDSHDALAFDPARIAGDRDIEVVHLSPRGGASAGNRSGTC